MRVLKSLVDDAHVRRPCDADWNAMVGDERVRFCASCEKNVHDLSAHTEGEAERLLRGEAGRICIIVERDASGRAITADRLPSGMTPARRLAMLAAAATVAMAVPFCGKTDAGPRDAGSPNDAASARRPGCYCDPGDPLCACL